MYTLVEWQKSVSCGPGVEGCHSQLVPNHYVYIMLHTGLVQCYGEPRNLDDLKNLQPHIGVHTVLDLDVSNEWLFSDTSLLGRKSTCFGQMPLKSAENPYNAVLPAQECEQR